jgi:hypothetical protein
MELASMFRHEFLRLRRDLTIRWGLIAVALFATLVGLKYFW